MSEPASPPASSWRQVIRPYLKVSIVIMLVLGFASGLPLMMVFSKLSFWLREVDITRSAIGGMYAVSLAYSIKFLWAPAVDRLPLPGLTRWLGQRRSWMLLAIAGTVLGLVLIALSNPAEGLTLTVAGALCLAFSGATLDIAVDAWRIESAPDDEQANMAAVYILGYRLAIMFSGLGLVIAAASSWGLAYGVMAAIMAGVGCLVFVIKEPERAASEARQVGLLRGMFDAIVQPFVQLVRRFQWWIIPVLFVVMTYRMSDFTMGVMTSPFYVDLLYSKETVGWITGLFGPWPVVVGGFIGGFVAIRFKLVPALILGGIVTLLTNGAFAALAWSAGGGLDAAAAGQADAVVLTPPVWALFLTILADNLAAGYVGAVFVAYLSSLTERKFAATQYALLSSAYSFLAKLIASTTSGPLSELVGWAGFFAVTAAFAIPPMAVILLMGRYGPGSVRGDREAAA